MSSYNKKKLLGKQYSTSNTLELNLKDYSQITGCEFKADVIVINSNHSLIQNTQFTGNNISFRGAYNEFYNCKDYSRYTQDLCCVICGKPIGLDDSIVSLKKDVYSLCKECSDMYLSVLEVAVKL